MEPFVEVPLIIHPGASVLVFLFGAPVILGLYGHSIGETALIDILVLGHIRIRKVDPNSFEIRLAEWEYQDDVHSLEEVTYLVTDKGEQYQSDGIKSVTSSTVTDRSWTYVEFYDSSESFDNTPIVLSNSQTHAGEATTTRHRNVGRSGFEVKLITEEARGDTRELEVGYFAIETGRGRLEGVPYEARIVEGAVDDSWYTLYFNQSYNDPTFLADMQSFNGGDPCNLRY